MNGVPTTGEPVRSAFAARARKSGARLVGSPLFWLFLVVVGMAVPFLNQVLRADGPPKHIYGNLPAFALTDQDGRAFGSAELKGYVWVASFIFSRCPTICPVITATMGKMQQRARGIENGFRLVSFSVDPGYDTPARLAEYGRAHHVSPRMWKLLTGSLDTMRAAVVEGLKVSMGQPVGDSDFASIFHGTHFVLVDQALRIRGYYDSSKPEVVDEVLHDATRLINRGD